MLILSIWQDHLIKLLTAELFWSTQLNYEHALLFNMHAYMYMHCKLPIIKYTST